MARSRVVSGLGVWLRIRTRPELAWPGSMLPLRRNGRPAGLTSSSPERLASTDTSAPATPVPAGTLHAASAMAEAAIPAANPASFARRWRRLGGPGARDILVTGGSKGVSGGRGGDRLGGPRCSNRPLAQALLVAGLEHVLVRAALVAGAAAGLVGGVVVLQLDVVLVGDRVVLVPLGLGQREVEQAVGVGVVGRTEVVQLTGVDVRARCVGREVRAVELRARAARDRKTGVVADLGVDRVRDVDLRGRK